MSHYRSEASMSVVKNPKKIYVGNIPRSTRESDIEDMFKKFGTIIALEYKGDFAFVEYANGECAGDAIKKYDGHRMEGRRLTVEAFRYRGGDPRYRRAPPDDVKRGQFRVIVSNLSNKTTPENLQDWAEDHKIKTITLTDVYCRHGLQEGVIEIRDEDEFENALKVLNDTKCDGYKVEVYDERDHNRRKLKYFESRGGYAPRMYRGGGPSFRGGGYGGPPRDSYRPQSRRDDRDRRHRSRSRSHGHKSSRRDRSRSRHRSRSRDKRDRSHKRDRSRSRRKERSRSGRRDRSRSGSRNRRR